MRLLLGVTLLAGCATVALAGCGTMHATGPLASAATPSPSRPAGTPQQRAETDAASILASFAVPPGARRLDKAPDVDGGLLKNRATGPASADLVDDASWWEVPGQPQALLAWEEAHLPRRFAPAGSGYGSIGGVPVNWSEAFALPAVPGVLNQRELVVEAVVAGHGQTAIRVDAQVTWQPPRPPAERVPSAARVVTITAQPGLLPGGRRPPAPVTITDVTLVRRIAKLVNGLPLFPPGVYACPAAFGGGIRLTFRARAAGPPLAVADTTIGGCGGVSFSVDGRQQPALADSAWLDSQVLKVAGLHWPGY